MVKSLPKNHESAYSISGGNNLNIFDLSSRFTREFLCKSVLKVSYVGQLCKSVVYGLNLVFSIIYMDYRFNTFTYKQ